jgi:hypothetical protein
MSLRACIASVREAGQEKCDSTTGRECSASGTIRTNPQGEQNKASGWMLFFHLIKSQKIKKQQT